MAEIIIPERLQKRMNQDDKWLKCVLQLRDNIEPFFLKDPNFFPDYTLHGTQHINRVLKLADQLIACDTLAKNIAPRDSDIEKYGLLTPRDVAFLICGILLHDMGMYLRPDGLKKLIKQEETEDAFGGKPWNQEWSEYVDRTKRLSQEKMRHHFGSVIPVTADCVDHADTDDNKRIIGEFLRQHHARLAHEFATGVLHGSMDTDLFANTGLKKKDRMMIGLLARSHGMSIRDTEEYLRTKFNATANPYNLPVFYLMSVLRLADYLDADGQRAPKQLTQQQKISVPISVEEWTWNQCINADVTKFDLHHKNYHVEADPETSRQYVHLDKWLKSVQADLDICWSILAEKYPYDRYRLSIHRVVSNIHEPGIQETMNEKFLTKEAKITANPEIIKLMMAPLYGNEPTYGVRELLQNAVDACVERKKWEEDHKKSEHDKSDYKGHVDIRIENGVFTITDNGMGMNEDVLLNYYLSAGSSYRSSDTWMAANAPDGKSQVARTGKFGVGFLAAFLLGDKVEVHTQHRKDNQGYSFTFSQESATLDVERLKRSEPGTTITIRLKPTAIKNWDNNPKWYNWYAFNDPVVSYTIDGIPVEHENLCLHRTPTEDDGWLELPSDDFEAYHWKPNLTSRQPEFYCNGIRIYHGFPDCMARSRPRIFYPHISILDKQGKLAVDLAREKLAEIPMENALLWEVLRWHIARLLLTPWVSPEDHLQNFTRGFILRDDSSYGNIPFLLAPGGFHLNQASLIPALSVQDYVVLYYDGPDARDARTAARDFLQADTSCTIVTDASSLPAIFANRSTSYRINPLDSWKIDYDASGNTHSLWFRPDVPNNLDNGSRNQITLFKTSNEAHLLTGSWKGQESVMPIDPKRFPVEQFPAVFHVVPNLSNYDFFMWDASLFVEMMKELLTPEPDYPDQDLWIPYDMEDRKQKFRRAFHELSDYIKHIQKEPEREARRKAEEAERKVRREAAQKARRRAETMAQLPRIQAELESKAASDNKFAADLLQRIAELQPKAASGDEKAVDHLSTLVEFSEIFLS